MSKSFTLQNFTLTMHFLISYSDWSQKKQWCLLKTSDRNKKDFKLKQTLHKIIFRSRFNNVTEIWHSHPVKVQAYWVDSNDNGSIAPYNRIIDSWGVHSSRRALNEASFSVNIKPMNESHAVNVKFIVWVICAIWSRV